MAEPRIDVAPESPPIVLGVAGRLKRSAADPALARRLRRMKGVIALRSSVDKQSATIRFDRGRISLASGVAPDAGLVITMNFNDEAEKPKVSGAARHPLLGLAAAKVLDPPARTWQEEATSFWSFASSDPRAPRSLLVVSTDDGSRLELGEPGDPDYEIHGSAKTLVSVFTGSSIFLEDVLGGRLMVVGNLQHASVLMGRAIAWALGEGR